MFQLDSKLIWMFQKSLISGKNIRFVRNYSKRSGSKNLGPYKIVNSNDVRQDSLDTRLDPSPNWELFGARGHRFLLPGSVGPGWHESGSMVPFDGFITKTAKPVKFDFEALECTAQECPVLLKDAIKELFPGLEPGTSHEWTVVTLSRKKLSMNKRDKDTEYHAKTFMWAAQEICLRLKMAGYWADFINPFSGRPYMSQHHKSTLYEANEKFRCMGFEVKSWGGTRIIQVTNPDEFVGSLFTNAPPSTEFLLDILSEQ